MEAGQTKPRSASELLALLESEQGNFGKGARRLAQFLVANPQNAAMMTSAEVAGRCGIHASSVVRLAQGFGFTGYRELQSLFQKELSATISGAGGPSGEKGIAAGTGSALRLHLLAESGRSFNEAAIAASGRFCATDRAVSIDCDMHLPHAIEARALARRIEAAVDGIDGLILVAREDPAINSAVKAVTARGIPVVCLTTDLPSSARTAFVGSDQYASGATAGLLCGRMLPRETPGNVLFVYSVPFRCQLDREQGFRQTLRTYFPALAIDEKVSSDESIEVIYDALRRYVAKNGPPAAIYNVSGANLGIGRALEDEGVGDTTIFIGHELNENSRALLERGVMDLAIGHDFDREIAMAVESIRTARAGRQPVNRITPSLIYTRFNCAVD